MHDPGAQQPFETLISRLSETMAQLHQVYKADIEAARLEVAHVRGVTALKHGNAGSNVEDFYGFDLGSVDICLERELEEEANDLVAEESNLWMEDAETVLEQQKSARKVTQVQEHLIEERQLREDSKRRSAGVDGKERKQTFTMRNPWIDHRWGDAITRMDTNLQDEKEYHLLTVASHIVRVEALEEDDIMDIPWYILLPNSRIRGFWLLACMTLLFYDIVMVPVEVCFDVEEAAFSFALDLFIVSFWTLDIILNFITGVPQNRLSDSVVTNPYQIARIYIKSWFIFDVCLVVPEWLTILIGTEDASDIDKVSEFRILRYARFVRLLRMARILKLSQFKVLMRQVIYMLHLSKVSVLLTQSWLFLTIILLVAIHVLSCFWYAIGNALDDGWVQTNGLKSASLGRSYAASMHWSFSRVHGMKSQFRVEAPSEMLLDGVLIYISLVVAAYYFGRVGAIAVTSASAQQNNLWKLSLLFEKRHRISGPLSVKVAKFLQCTSSYGAGEAAAEEQVLLDALPSTLRNDLVFEARFPSLMVMQLFKDMLSYSPRSVRQVCTEAIQARVFTEGEVVFAYSDACLGVLIFTSGQATYVGGPVAMRTVMSSIIERQPSWSAPLRSTALSKWYSEYEEDLVTVGTNKAVSEPALWTQWCHAGSLAATEESTALLLDPKSMGTAIQERPITLGHVVKYAIHFVRRLNSAEYTDDLTCFPDLNLEVVNDELFDGDTNEHFVFISHYKFEAGTEASLMRDLMVGMLRQDPNHPAHDLRSPIFIDSEDLDDLAGLKTHVENTTALVVLLTPGVLTRPWCLVEIVTAHRNNLNLVPVEVQRPGAAYSYPNDQFYADILDGKFLSPSAVDVLQNEEIRLEDVEKAIRQLFLKIALPFSPHKTKAVREAELQDILMRCRK